MGDFAAFVRDRFIPLFERGVTSLQAKSRRGDSEAEAALADIVAVRHAVRVDLEGAGTLFVVVEGGTMRLADEAPTGFPVRAALALPVEAVREWLADVPGSSDMATDEVAERVAKSVSKRVDEALGNEPLNFHVILTDPPDFADVVVRVGLGAEAPPATPGFTAAVPWDSLQDMRETPSSLPHLFMSGRVRLGGDYSRALQLAMTFMAPTQ